jgi:RNA polymerase-binding transcription factor DksA
VTAKKPAKSKAAPKRSVVEHKAPEPKVVHAKKLHAPKTVKMATAASILGLASGSGPANGKVNVKPEWAKYYHNLIELRERLTSQMSGRAKESAEEMDSYSLHMADAGTDNFDRDFALSLLSADQDAIYEIDAAIKRIQRGTYGVCEITGNPIPKARLEAIPWTRFTVEAQAQLERDGALKQRRLASLGSVDAAGPAEVEDDLEDDEKPAKEKE